MYSISQRAQEGGEGEQQGTVAASLKRVTTSHHHSEQQGVAISSSGSDQESVQYREVKEGEGGKEIEETEAAMAEKRGWRGTSPLDLQDNGEDDIEARE